MGQGVMAIKIVRLSHQVPVAISRTSILSRVSGPYVSSAWEWCLLRPPLLRTQYGRVDLDSCIRGAQALRNTF